MGQTERGWDDNLRLVDGLCESLEQLGASNVFASRVGDYRRAFHRIREGDPFEIPTDDLPSLLASLTEFHGLRRIVFAAERSPDPDAWAAQIKAIPKGVAFSSDPDPRPDGRDTQFECFVAAVALLGGASVMFAEPDVVVTHAGETVGVAAKRPRSLKKCARNAQKGVRQVRASGLKGLLAVDYSTALHHGQYFQAATPEEAKLRVRASTDSATRDLAHEVGRSALEAGVMGIIGHVMVPGVHRETTRGLGISTAMRWTLVKLQREEGAADPWLDDFDAVCRQGLATPLPGDIQR